MSACTTDPVLTLLLAARPRVALRLQRAFPTACTGQVEDAVSTAVSEVWLARDRWNDTTRPGSLLYTVAWRHLRGEFRRAYHRREVLADRLPEGVSATDPLALLEARQTAMRIRDLTPEAARRYAPRRAPGLASALVDRFDGGESDVVVAARHGVDRTLLCRARLWIQEICVRDAASHHA